MDLGCPCDSRPRRRYNGGGTAHPQKETAWFGWQGRETQDSFFSGYLAGVSGVCSIWIKEVAV